MEYINSIPLNGKITVYTGTGEVDMFGKSDYVRTVHNAAIFKKSKFSRTNYMREKLVTNVVFVKAVISENALIYLSETTAEDPATIETLEVQEFSPMEDVNQNVIGCKIWV